MREENNVARSLEAGYFVWSWDKELRNCWSKEENNVAREPRLDISFGPGTKS